jgi:hypothetical protein
VREFIGPDPVAAITDAIDRVKAASRVIVCHPDLAEAIQAEVDRAQVGGLVTVRPDNLAPLGLAYVINPSATSHYTEASR